MTDLHDLLDLLKRTRPETLRHEVENLEAIRDWAQRQAFGDVKPGDVVKIAEGFRIARGPESGWWHYRECLAPGSGAEVTEIKFSTVHGRWYALIRPLRQWSVGGFRDPEERHWHGPAADTPEGMEPPSEFDQEHYPEGRKHTFMFWPEDLDLPQGAGL